MLPDRYEIWLNRRVFRSFAVKVGVAKLRMNT